MKSEATPGREELLAANMQASIQVGPLQCSQGGHPYNGDHIEYWKSRAIKAERRIAEDTRLASNAREALKPFATFGIGEGGEDIRDGLMRDRICDWFGPSDFDAARKALSTTGEPKR